jgi:hypothetical protein
MVEFVHALSGITWPAAFTLVGVTAAIVWGFVAFWRSL